MGRKTESKFKICNALLILLDKKTIDKIKINEICAEAKVNRSTFYFYYSSIDDVISEIVELANAKLKYYICEFRNEDNQKINELSPQQLKIVFENEILPTQLQYIKDNCKRYKVIINNLNLFQIERTNHYLYENFYIPYSSEFNISEEYKRTLFIFYSSAILGVIVDWINHDCKKSINELITVINHSLCFIQSVM